MSRLRHLQLAVALVLYATESVALAAEAPTLLEIASGMTRRKYMQITDLEVRFRTQMTRTDFYYELTDFRAQLQAQTSRRSAIAPREPQTETSIYELREHLPHKLHQRMWSRFAEDGSLVTMHACDGTVYRWYQRNNAPGSRASVSAGKREVPQPFFRPEDIGEVLGKPLIGPLDDPQFRSKILSTRVVDGEQFVDLEVINEYPAADKSGIWVRKSQATINVSRQYWPVFVKSEWGPSATAKLQSAVGSSSQEITATGWIESGGMSYPRHIEIRQFQSLPDKAELPLPEGTKRAPQLCYIHTIDVEKVVINAGIPDAAFSPQFPVGEIYQDGRDQKQKYYEVDPAGKSIAYVPRPRGLRGAVFVYHVCWMTALAAYGIWRSRTTT